MTVREHHMVKSRGLTDHRPRNLALRTADGALSG